MVLNLNFQAYIRVLPTENLICQLQAEVRNNLCRNIIFYHNKPTVLAGGKSVRERGACRDFLPQVKKKKSEQSGLQHTDNLT